MTAIRDLERCNEIPLKCDVLLAVGWLGPDTEFEKGPVSPEFHEKLRTLCADPWQPVVSAGFHKCELCQFEGPPSFDNVFVPFRGKIYVAPVGVVHYVASHWYKPPQIFIDAVLACPPMGSMEYRKAILANGGHSLVGR